MSVTSRRVKSVGRLVAQLKLRESRERSPWKRHWSTVQRWFLMLYHEYLRDDVRIRAQSLAFLMIFSLLPLIAGAFFIFSFLAQFGMVQDSITRMTNEFLFTIPEAHREFIQEYILRFKDAYLANLSRSSGTVGIFALAVLGWVGLQTFNNVDSTLNFIWSAEQTRTFYEKVRGFIVVVVLAPVVLTGGFSVPLILNRIAFTRYFFVQFPILGVLLNYFLPLVLVFGIFFTMYRFVPVRRVWWRAAFAGALFATCAMAVTNFLMRLYFTFGTHSAYGKAAAVPLIGFWIYALWIVVILGAEVSFLVQNEKELFSDTERHPTLMEGEALLACLVFLYQAHRDARGGVSFEALREAAGVQSGALRFAIAFLEKENVIVECTPSASSDTHFYVLARQADTLDLCALLSRFFRLRENSTTLLGKQWNKNLRAWVQGFEKIRLPDLAK